MKSAKKIQTLKEDMVLYRAKDARMILAVPVQGETVWLNLDQMTKLFGRDKSTISRHISNIFKEKELERKSTVANFATVQMEGGHFVERVIEYFNLDAIISVGYRVKSKRGVQFRQWATRILRDYLLKRHSQLEQQAKALQDVPQVVQLVQNVVENRALNQDETRSLVRVIHDYTRALTLLDQYDHGKLRIEKTFAKIKFTITYQDAQKAISLLAKTQKVASDSLFGKEQDDSFRSSLATIEQTHQGRDLYPSIEEKAAHLLYFVVKNHSFVDGNKRIAAFLFLWYLERNRHLYDHAGNKRLADNALVALTLMIAESKPAEKDMMIKVIVNLINREN